MISVMRQRLFLIGALVLTCLLSPAPGQAAADDLPSDFTDQLTSQAETFREAPEDLGLASEEIPTIDLGEDKETSSDEEGPAFVVKTIYFQGNTVVSEKAFSEYAYSFEDRKTTFAELKQFAKIVTDHYRSLGYVTSRAYLAPQTVQDQTVTIRVIEGKIGNIFVEGNKHFRQDVYRDSIRLRPDRIFRFGDLEDSLYFLNQHPDRKAKAYLIAGADPGTSDIILKAQDKRPFHGSYEFSNRGTKLTHLSHHTANFKHGNFMGLGHDFNASFTGAEEGAFSAGSFQYAVPFRQNGTTFDLSGSFADSLLVKHLKRLEIEGESWTLVPGVTQNLIRKPSLQFDLSAALEVKDSETLVDDRRSAFDRMRVLRFGPRVAFQNRSGRTTASYDVHWGIPGLLGGLDAVDPRASRRDSGNEFTYYTANVSHVRRVWREALMVLRANAQWTDDNLTSLEQFRAGGAYSVRGYPESEALGEKGYGFSAELGAPLWFIPKKATIPKTKTKWRKALRLVGFLDGAKTFSNTRLTDTSVKDKFLLSVGYGLRVNLERDLAFQVDVGYPIGDDSSDEDRPQTHFSMRAGF